LEASGHVDAFNDPLIDNKDSKEDIEPMFWLKIMLKSLIKNQDRKKHVLVWWCFQRTEICYDKCACNGIQSRSEILERSLGNEFGRCESINRRIRNCLSRIWFWNGPKCVNLTWCLDKIGASADSAMDLYLRPETAQGIFLISWMCKNQDEWKFLLG
jgi:glycyl-tRNA synthetase